MLENAVYSVISPESCAAIIYRDSGKAEQAAAALRLTAQDLLSFGLIDDIVPEPAEVPKRTPQRRRKTCASISTAIWANSPRSTPSSWWNTATGSSAKMGNFFA